MVRKRRVTKKSVIRSHSKQNGAPNRRVSGRRKSRQDEFFPDQVQKKILSCLIESNGEVSVSKIYDLCLSVGIKKSVIKEKIKELERLRILIITSDAIVTKGASLCVASGKVELHRDGFGFFIHDEPDDWYIRPQDTRGLLNGDEIVALRVLNSSPDRAPFAFPLLQNRQGSRRVILVVDNVRGVLTSRVLAGELKSEVVLPAETLSSLVFDDVILAELGQFDESLEIWHAELVEHLGSMNDPGIEVAVALHKFNVAGVRSDSLDSEVALIPNSVDAADILGRIDLRELPFVTIDGPDAKDFDDAVHVRVVDDGFILHVAIADVSHYVKENSLIDRDARKRTTSVYFPKVVFPMLPEELSSGTCSLKPNQDRLVVAVEIRFDANAAVIETNFFSGVIHSHKRLTYKEVDRILDDSQFASDTGLPSGVLDSLVALEALTKVLLKNRVSRGALEINARESAFVFDDAGMVSAISPQQRYFSSRMIEESMLCANVAAAEFLKVSKQPFLYRGHPEPEAAKILKLTDLLNSIGVDLKIPVRPKPSDFSRVLDECFNHEAVDALQTAVLRTMSQARYTPIPTSHFGLAYESYCHFTSPIRRYPDLIVHRAIKNVLLTAQEKKSDLHELGEHCSDTERKVEEAVRWVHGWLNASVARQHIGEEHIGRIVSIASFGCFIFIESLCLEGLLHVSELGHEFFYLEEGGVAFKGENSGKTYFLGDSVSITIRDADIETGRVTLKRETSGHNKRYVKQ